MGFGGGGGGCQAGRRFHFDFTSPTTGECCPPVMETYTFLAFLAFTPAATWFLRFSSLIFLLNSAIRGAVTKNISGRKRKRSADNQGIFIVCKAD